MGTNGLISVQWLKDNLRLKDKSGRKIVRVLDASIDASLIIPGAEPTGHATFEKAHIPSAQFFDIEAISDPSSGLPHTLPTPEVFEEAVRALGINAEDHVVVYDNSALRSAARAWWMFRVMGHEKVSVLDGGLAAWKTSGFQMENTPSASARGNFTSNFQPALFSNMDDVLSATKKKDNRVIVDARGAPRFLGETPEPRPGLAAGHMPTAVNIPFGTLYTPTGHLKKKDKLKDVFDEAGVAINKPIIASCGSGVTACTIAHALYVLGNKDVAIYDGSWVEWGSNDSTPKVIGDADES